MNESELYEYLARHQITYQRLEHPAVFTVPQANQYLQNEPGARTKNLFITDEKKRHYYIVWVQSDKQVFFNKLGKDLGLGKLRFGSPEKLKELLGLEPGSVSVLALINDTQNQVSLLADRSLWQADSFQCHPLINTVTLVINREGLTRFFELSGHPPSVVDIPEKPASLDQEGIHGG